MSNIQIAIDGPSGSGKSSISRFLSETLDFPYLDTGAMYRSVGLFVLNCGVDPENAEAVAKCIEDIDFSFDFCDGEQRVYLSGVDVTDKIRTEDVSICTSHVSGIPAVRQFLLKAQRDFADNNSVILDGRDIGTNILPNAHVKLFITADLDTRAMRRYKEHISMGSDISYEEVYASVKRRDEQDSGRATAPLRPADDAIIIDTGAMSLSQVRDYVLKTVREKTGVI